MKKLSLLLVIAMLVSCIPCISFAENTKLAEWIPTEITNTNQVANSVDASNYLEVNSGVTVSDIGFQYSNAKYIKPNGSKAKYEVKNAGSLATQMNNGFTYEAWIQPADCGWAEAKYPRLLCIKDSSGNVKFEIRYETGTSPKYATSLSIIRTGTDSSKIKLVGSAYNAPEADRIAFTNWYHIVVSVGPNSNTRELSEVKLFVNGSQKTLSGEPEGSGTPLPFEATDTMFIGSNELSYTNTTKQSNTTIYEGTMVAADAKVLYENLKSNYNMVYDAIVKKDGTLVPKADLANIVEGNVTVEATITASSDRTESNVYVLNKATNQKVPFTFAKSGNTVTLTAPDNYLVAGTYQFVIENKGQRLDFAVVEDAIGRQEAVDAVNAALANPGTDYANIKTAIFTTYKKFFQISDAAGSDYDSVLNKNGIYEAFTQATSFATVADVITAFNAAIETQKLNDFGDAVDELKTKMTAGNVDDFKEFLLNGMFKEIFDLPVGTGSVYASLGTSQDVVFTQLIATNIENLSDVNVVATIKAKFDEICAEQRFTLDYNAFYVEIDGASAANIESKLKNNIDKTGINLVQSNTELWSDYQDNKSAVNAKLADADISTKTNLRNEFYSALTLAVLNGAGNDRAVTKRALANYATNVDGVDANLAANIDAVAIELTGRNFSDMNDLIDQIGEAVENADGNGSGDIGGATPKDPVFSIPGGGTYGYVVNSNQPGFTVPDKDKVDEKPAEVKGFTDLEGYDWAAEYINKLYDLGVVNGKAANTFAPADNVTRFEYVAMLTRAFNLEGEAELPFADVQADHWAYAAVKAAYALGIVGGVDAYTFDGNSSITREAMATIVYRFLDAGEVENATEYADDAEISDWAYDAVYKMQELGLMNGKDGNTFDPKGLATRAETATLICRLMESYAE